MVPTLSIMLRYSSFSSLNERIPLVGIGEDLYLVGLDLFINCLCYYLYNLVTNSFVSS